MIVNFDEIGKLDATDKHWVSKMLEQACIRKESPVSLIETKLSNRRVYLPMGTKENPADANAFMLRIVGVFPGCALEDVSDRDRPQFVVLKISLLLQEVAQTA